MKVIHTKIFELLFWPQVSEAKMFHTHARLNMPSKVLCKNSTFIQGSTEVFLYKEVGCVRVW